LVKSQVPAPVLVTVVAPVLSAMAAARILLAVLVPVSVNVLVPIWPLKPMEPVLLKLTAPLPEASNVPPLVPTLNNLSVLTVPPVYFKVPPLRIKFAAALDDSPMPEAAPPLAKTLTLNVPPLIVVEPV